MMNEPSPSANNIPRPVDDDDDEEEEEESIRKENKLWVRLNSVEKSGVSVSE